MAEQPDIIDRLTAYVESNILLGYYTEAQCADDAIEEIKRLRFELETLRGDLNVVKLMLDAKAST